MYLIIGLGNPEKKYEKTRHNVGRILVEKIASRAIYPPDEDCFELNKKLSAEICKVDIGGEEAVLAKPTVFMNQSGESAQKLVDFFQADAKNVVILSDDINLNPGSARIRFGGESGGHNGLKSVASAIGPDFWRVRVGVGSSGTLDLEDFVLQKFSPVEHEAIDQVVDKVAEDLILLISAGKIESKTINCGSSVDLNASIIKEKDGKESKNRKD